MANANIKLGVTGVDSTGAAFKSVEARAKAVSARLRGMLGGALAAAGAYLSFRSIKGGIEELGALSDAAQRAGVNTMELTQAANAMNILGVSTGVDGLAKAFQIMEKNTGRTGLAGFYDTIEEIGKIEDQSERAKAAISVFGRSGMQFMPLINAADESVEALQGVVSAMPGIPQTAAKAGNDASNAMATMAEGVKSIWLQGIGWIVGLFGKQYEGGIRAAAAAAANWLEYHAKLAVAKVRKIYYSLTDPIRNLGALIGGFLGSEGSIGERWEEAKRIAAEMADERAAERAEEDKIWEDRVERARIEYENKKIEIENLKTNFTAAAVTVTRNARRDLRGLDMNEDRAPKTVSNSLVMAGTNDARRLALNAPQLNEAKKQTSILEKIAENTKKTTEEIENLDPGESYNALDY